MTLTIFVLTLRQLLGKRRAILMIGFGLLPTGASLLLRFNVDDNTTDLDIARWIAIVLMNGLIVTTLLPLVALVFGTTALGGEIEDGTAVYLLSKPVARWKIVIAKLLAAWLVTALLVSASAALAGGVASNGSDEQGIVTGFVLASILGSLVYTCVFMLLSIVTSRALIIGLIYVFFWETIITVLFDGTKFFSVRQYTIGVARLASDASTGVFDSRLDGNEALALMAGAAVVAVLLAVRQLQRFQIGEST